MCTVPGYFLDLLQRLDPETLEQERCLGPGTIQFQHPHANPERCDRNLYPIPAPKKFEPFRYENTALADPFSQSKLALAVAQAAPAKGNGLKPDAARRRETLESFPLDNIKMVGHMTNGRNDFALLQVEAMVYQARVGNYAGQNFGRIVRVTESEVTLKELVQDAAGDWVERDSALRLQEGRK